VTILGVSMIWLVELLLSSLNVIFLFFGGLFSYILGSNVYRLINNFFYANSVPCIEMISFIVALVSPLAFFYGVHHKKAFFQRENRYNVGIFVLAFLFGTVLTLMPLHYTFLGQTYCPEQLTFLGRVAQSVSAGIITASLAYLGFDTGVIYAKLITPIMRRNTAMRTRQK
jgi:hypothetical protein